MTPVSKEWMRARPTVECALCRARFDEPIFLRHISNEHDLEGDLYDILHGSPALSLPQYR